MKHKFTSVEEQMRGLVTVKMRKKKRPLVTSQIDQCQVKRIKGRPRNEYLLPQHQQNRPKSVLQPPMIEEISDAPKRGRGRPRKIPAATVTRYEHD